MHPFLHPQCRSSLQARIASWQQCSLYIPSICCILLPAQGRQQDKKLRVCKQHLSPNMTSLVRSSLAVLNQCCRCWGKSIDCLHLLVNSCLWVLFTECSLLVWSHSKTMHLSKRFIDINDRWFICEVTEGASVTSLDAIHTFQAIFPSLPHHHTQWRQGTYK